MGSARCLHAAACSSVLYLLHLRCASFCVLAHRARGLRHLAPALHTGHVTWVAHVGLPPAGGSSFIVVCSSDLDCGGGTCTANNMGDVCEESGECTGGAECVLACPSQYLLSGLRSARPHEVQVETGAFVDRMWEPCVHNPQACDAAVFSGLLSPPSPPSSPPVLCACT